MLVLAQLLMGDPGYLLGLSWQNELGDRNFLALLISFHNGEEMMENMKSPSCLGNG